MHATPQMRGIKFRTKRREEKKISVEQNPYVCL